MKGVRTRPWVPIYSCHIGKEKDLILWGAECCESPELRRQKSILTQEGRWAQTSIAQGREISSGDGACAGGLDGQQCGGQGDYWTLKIK